MSDAEFKMQMDHLIQMLGMMHTATEFVDLPFIRKTLEQVDTLGPILEPTLYARRSDKALRAQRRALEIHEQIRAFVKEFGP